MFGSRKYLFTSKKTSYKGIASFISGAFSFAAFLLVLSIVAITGGEADARHGAVGIVSFILSISGLVLGIMSICEKDTFRLFPWLGTIISFLTFTIWGGIIYVGFTGLPW